MQPLPYAEVTDDAYAAEAAATLTVSEFGPAVVLSGGCPRCHDPFTFTLVNEVFRGETPGPAPVYDTIFCTCLADHPQRADGQAGCGAYWTVHRDTAP
jgi:hypothetical protein